MEDWIIAYQYYCRFGLFLGILALLTLWETKDAWRPWLIERKLRWFRHLSLSLISKVCLKLLFPFFTVGVAVIIAEKQMGLMATPLLPNWLKVLLGVIAMDFVIYLQHRFMHKYTLFWRFHKVHHVDTMVDVTTGLRFHPLEELYTMAAKMLGVGIFGVPVLAAFLYEIWLNAASLFTHTNVFIDPKVDKWLRTLLVTPNMHRTHHSDLPKETNSNYGFGLSIWDKIFGTYVAFPQTGERKLSIGLEEYHAPKYQTLENMLLLPFGIRALKVWPKRIRPTKKKDFEKLT